MAHLTDKAALVAEIERRLRELSQLEKASYEIGLYDAYKIVLSFLDTLEVKEVDLEKYYHDFLQKEWFDKKCNRTMSEMMAFTAKHFFELGLKAEQKGE